MINMAYHDGCGQAQNDGYCDKDTEPFYVVYHGNPHNLIPGKYFDKILKPGKFSAANTVPFEKRHDQCAESRAGGKADMQNKRRKNKRIGTMPAVLIVLIFPIARPHSNSWNIGHSAITAEWFRIVQTVYAIRG